MFKQTKNSRVFKSKRQNNSHDYCKELWGAIGVSRSSQKHSVGLMSRFCSGHSSSYTRPRQTMSHKDDAGTRLGSFLPVSSRCATNLCLQFQGGPDVQNVYILKSTFSPSNAVGVNLQQHILVVSFGT